MRPLQPERIREPNPDAEDEAYDRARQREVDAENFCACGRELRSEAEQRDRVCRECL